MKNKLIAEDIFENKNQVKIIGNVPLRGETTVDGSKNAVLQLMAAASMAKEGYTTLYNVPNISDVIDMCEMMKEIGVEGHLNGSVLKINGSISKSKISKKYATKIRASILWLGVLLGTLGEAELPLPGGDKIGEQRPVDIHLDCFKELGVDSYISGGVIYAKARKLPLAGKDIFLRYPSVTATANLMLAAVLAEGKTTIYNAAHEPEIVDLSIMLSKMGAKIFGVGTGTISVYGVDRLTGTIHEPIPDRLEAGTLLTAIAITGGEGIIRNCVPEHNTALVNALEKAGVTIKVKDENSLQIFKSKLKSPINISAMPYPGFPTDLQPIITSLATQCPGESTIADLVFTQRFAHVTDLVKLGAKINVVGNQARVIGGEKLIGTYVEGNDIRTVTSLICAGLVSDGTTYVKGTEHLFRGHGDLIKKLNDLNAFIECI